MNCAGFTKASQDLYPFENHYSHLQVGPVSRRGPRSNDLSKSHFTGHVKFCRGEAATHDPPQLPLECWGIILKGIEHAPAGPSPWVSLVEVETPPTKLLRNWFWLWCFILLA